MAQRKRYIVLGILAFFFLITAPLIIFYTLGWRVDFKSLKISQPGIFYFKAFPNSIRVLINNKEKKKTDFLFGATMIENMSPAKYNVQLVKDGFHTWTKNLEIKKGEATEAKNVILFPNNPEIKMVSGNIDEIYVSPYGKSIIIKETDKKAKTWSLKMIEPKTNIKSHLINEKDFIAKIGLKMENISSEQIKEMTFSENERTVIIKMAIKEINKTTLNYYFVIETDNSPPTLTYLDFLKQNTIKVGFNPVNDKKLAVTYPNTKSKIILAEADLEMMKISETRVSDVLDFTIFDGKYYYLDNSGFIYKADASFLLPTKVNSKPMDILNKANYSIAVTSFGITIKENNSLYYFNYETNEMKKLSTVISGFSFSKSIYKMAYWNTDISVLFMDKENYQPQKKVGDEIILAELKEKISNAIWLNDFYLALNIKDQIKIIETDDRDQINIVDFASYPEPEIFWNRNDKILFVFSNNTLYSFENLIP